MSIAISGHLSPVRDGSRRILRALRSFARLEAVLPFVPAALALAMIARLDSPLNDRFQFWLAGHLVVTGGSPYDQPAWAAAAATYGDAAALVARNCPDAQASTCLWAYPPWTAWLFAPFGLLDHSRGVAAIGAVLLIVGAASAVALAHSVPVTPRSRAVVALVTVGSAPFVWDSFLGHFEPLLLVGALLVGRGMRARRAATVAAGAVLLSLKPNLAIGVVPVVTGVLVARRAWWIIGVTVAALGGLAAAGVAREPAAVAAIAGAGAKTAIVLPTTWSFAARYAPGIAPLVAGVLIATAMAAAWLAVRSAPAVIAELVLLAVGLGLSLAVTPYAHLYDQLLLLPAVAAGIAVLDAHGRRPRMAGWLGFGFGFVALTWLAFLGGPHGDEPVWTALIPVLTLVALAAVTSARPVGRPV